MCERELEPKLGSNRKAKERAKGKKVLKSAAGAMTLLGALFIVHHVRYGVCSFKGSIPWLCCVPLKRLWHRSDGRQKREKEKNAESIVPQRNRKPGQKLSEQKKAEIVKPGVLYHGERLKL